MKLNCLAGAHEITNSNHARLGIGTDHVADKKIAPFKMILILASSPSHVERRSHQLAIGGIEESVYFAQTLKGRSTTQFYNRVFICLGDHHWSANRSAPLRNNRTDSDSAANHNAHRSRVVRPRIDHKSVAAWLMATACHAAHNRYAGMIFFHPSDQCVDRK